MLPTYVVKRYAPLANLVTQTMLYPPDHVVKRITLPTKAVKRFSLPTNVVKHTMLIVFPEKISDDRKNNLVCFLLIVCACCV